MPLTDKPTQWLAIRDELAEVKTHIEVLGQAWKVDCENSQPPCFDTGEKALFVSLK
jgi:hypothetical protein